MLCESYSSALRSSCIYKMDIYPACYVKVSLSCEGHLGPAYQHAAPKHGQCKPQSYS